MLYGYQPTRSEEKKELAKRVKAKSHVRQRLMGKRLDFSAPAKRAID
jgi:DNA-directed RNA polymerase beta' subunit